MGERAVAEPQEAAVQRPDPEIAVPRCAERGDVFGRPVRLGPLIEDDEPDAVEPGEAALRADPEVPVTALGDGLDPIAGKPLIRGPRAARERRRASEDHLPTRRMGRGARGSRGCQQNDGHEREAHPSPDTRRAVLANSMVSFGRRPRRSGAAVACPNPT